MQYGVFGPSKFDGSFYSLGSLALLTALVLGGKYGNSNARSLDGKMLNSLMLLRSQRLVGTADEHSWCCYVV